MKDQISNIFNPPSLYSFKVAEHFTRALLLMRFSTCTRIAQAKMPLIQRSFYLLKPSLSLLFFFVIERSVLMALVFYNKGMLEKVTMQRTQQFSDFFSIERIQLNAARVQLVEKLRPIAFAETCRSIQSLAFQEIWQKKSSQTTQMIYD